MLSRYCGAGWAITTRNSSSFIDLFNVSTIVNLSRGRSYLIDHGNTLVTKYMKVYEGIYIITMVVGCAYHFLQ